jgi:hypothetical protein
MKFSEVTRSPYLAEVVEGLNSFCKDETPIRDSFGRSPNTGLPKPSRMRAMWREICESSGGSIQTAPVSLPPTQQPILTARANVSPPANVPLAETSAVEPGPRSVNLWYAQTSFQAFQSRGQCTHKPYTPRVKVTS